MPTTMFVKTSTTSAKSQSKSVMRIEHSNITMMTKHKDRVEELKDNHIKLIGS